MTKSDITLLTSSFQRINKILKDYVGPDGGSSTTDRDWET